MKLKFNNGKFVILQVSDAQDLQYTRPAMLKMLARAYDSVKPDIVLFTGDNILGNHLCDARFGSRKVVKTKAGEYINMLRAIDNLISPVEKRKIPFAVIYGNHDDMNMISREAQADIYRSYSMNRGLWGQRDSLDCDSYVLPVYSSDGNAHIFNIWMLDSAWKNKEENKCYTGVKKETVDWYIKTSNAFREENCGKAVDSLMFQHIPMPETARLMKHCSGSDKGALCVYGKNSEKEYVKLDETAAKGVLGEPIGGCELNFGQFEAVKAQGDVRAVVFGHEHRNNYEAVLDGVNIIQTAAASFRCYGSDNRGVRVFEIDENDTKNIKTRYLTYSLLVGDSLWDRLRYIWDADGEGKKKAALIAAGGTVFAASGAAMSVLLRNIKNIRR